MSSTSSLNQSRSNLFDAIRACYEQTPVRSLKYLPDNSEALIEKFCWLVACGDILLPEYRFKWPHVAWWEDAEFTRYLRQFSEDRGFNTDRRWDLSQLLRLTTGIEGDMVECGSYQGAAASLMADLCQKTGRHLHLFDSFEGLSAPADCDGNHWKKNALTAAEEMLHQNLAPYAGSYTTYKGWIPDRFCDFSAQLAFLHLDVDLYQPTKDSIEFFYPRMVAGAVCICDDYGSTLCPGAKLAMDEFLADKPEKMLSLSGGSGFFIKGTRTGK